jgi:hypothetical protein
MRWLLIIVSFALLEACTAYVSKTAVKPTNEELLSLSYARFDQTPNEGWRILGEGLGKYVEAAKLIDKYLASNSNSLELWQIRVLKWHAGQMYAFCDDINMARQRFFESTDQQEPKGNPILWNDYVRATVAFLNKDMDELQKHRKIISEGPQFNGSIPNLDVVDGLIRCFDRTYREAYSHCRR